jgi:predicted aspartyl protease
MPVLRKEPLPKRRPKLREWFLIAGCLFVASSCSRIDKSVRILPTGPENRETAAVGFSDFRRAFVNFDFSGIAVADLDAGSRALMQGMLLVMAGDMAGAEPIFRKLAVTAEDDWNRAIATEILVQLFYFQSKWKNLHDMFVPESALDHGAAENDLSFLEMSRARTEYVRFPSRPVVLPMELSHSGTPVVRLRINGQWENFWLDTGSGFTVLASDLADKLKILPLNRTRSRAATSTSKMVSARLTVIESIQLGDIEITRHPAMIVQKKDLFFKIPGLFRSRIITKTTGIRGVLGVNAIKNMSLRMDFPNRRIIISRPEKNAAGEHNLFWAGYPILACRSMDGDLLHFGVDTGAKQSVISPNLFTKIKTGDTYRIRLKVWGAGGEMKTRTQVLPDLKISVAGHTAVFRDIVVLPLDQFGFVRLDGILGSDFFAACGSMVFDLANGVFAIEKAR